MNNNITPSLLQFSIDINSVKLDPQNSRTGHDTEGISTSLNQFGQLIPIIVNKNTGIIVKGNGTFKSAKKLGWTKIAAVFVEFNQANATSFSIADNRLGEKSHWDIDVLFKNISTLEDGYVIPGIDDSFLNDLFKDIAKHVKVVILEPEREMVVLQPTREVSQKLAELQKQLGGKTLEDAIEHVIANHVSKDVAMKLGALQEKLGTKSLDDTINRVVDNVAVPLKSGEGTIVENPQSEWVGMPEFQNDDVFGAIHTLKVNFKTLKDIDTFSELVSQKVTNKTRSIWFPFIENENLMLYTEINNE